MTTLVHVATTLPDASRFAVLHRTAEESGAELAFLQGGEPTLTHLLDVLHASGVREVRLQPVSTGDVTYARSWVGRVAGHWHRQQIDPPTIHFGQKLITGREAPLFSPVWHRPPDYRHHMLLCRGPRCSAHGSDETHRELTKAFARHELTDEDVLLTQTGCLFPCNRAPVAVVHPDSTWYGPVRPAEVERLVHDHLVRGQLVPHLRIETEHPSSEGEH